ncbi:MAG: acyl-CoA dehydrogenase family protein [Phycisphaerae bacterium]|nr:acyl-CoA dehydrogenase family protein [Phycisphaerae bacterium]
MGNFYKDNEDIQFLFRHLDLDKIAQLQEEDFRYAKDFDYAPEDACEAKQNYEMVLDAMGRLSADYIAPRSEDIDQEGNTLNEDGTVSYAKGIANALNALAKANVMGFTLPHRFGGLNFPNTIYSIAIEIVSRADASLMNLFGLQGIAETINFFADDDIKQHYLPDFAAGKVTGSMVLTEPDAGSDLQACKLRAFQDDDGNWYLHGVKRFITNGCSDVLLVLARSEERIGGLGLSLFVCDRGPTIKVRRLEDKLGIHGSPTCELFFDNTPCQIIGERQRGLVTYVMSLMNGARIGIAGQSMGIAEATYRVARDYAASREQFGVPIEKLPAVRDMVINMKMAIEAGRALLYQTSWIVDHEIGLNKIIERNEDKDSVKATRQELKFIKRLAGMLTPMSKYFCSEMSNTVSYDAIQVLGGSGYMRDYACERHARDARITTIYEGTSQLQVVAAVRGVCSGTGEKYLAQLAGKNYADSVKDLTKLLAEGTDTLLKAAVFVKEQGVDYMDLYGRQIVDMAIALIIGYYFCDQASSQVDMEVAIADNGDAEAPKTIPMVKRKEIIARRYITRNAALIKSLAEEVFSGDKTTFKEYETLIGPVPEIA